MLFRSVAVWLAAIAIAGLVVNWRSELWSQEHEDVVKAVYSNTDPALPIMTDQPATVKFLNEVHGPRTLVDLDLGDANQDVRRAQLLQLLGRNPTVQIVLFGRDDSDYWLNKSKDDRAFITAISRELHTKLQVQQRFAGLGVLRIWNVRI